MSEDEPARVIGFVLNNLSGPFRSGLAEAVCERARRGRRVLGICGGMQMLARTIAVARLA
jgi:cobyric acid synthase